MNPAPEHQGAPGKQDPLCCWPSRQHAFMRNEHAALVRVVPILLVFTAQVWASSLDTWTVRNPLPTANALFAVTYRNDQFVAMGDFGTIITSPDGVNWMLRQSGTTNRLSVCLSRSAEIHYAQTPQSLLRTNGLRFAG